MIASFHLIRYPRERLVWGFQRMGLDRPDLKQVPGLRFRRLAGTARGETFAWAADPLRWALIAAWDDEAALDAFLATSPVVERWHEHASEVWTARLAPISSVGRWGGANPFATDADPPDEGRFAVITRARLRPRRLPSFFRAVPPIDVDIHAAEGRIASVGFGESPFLHQGTLSVWTSLDAMRDFAYGSPAHLEAIRRTHDEDWFAEDLFARFRVVGTEGTWNGVDPGAL